MINDDRKEKIYIIIHLPNSVQSCITVLFTGSGYTQLLCQLFWILCRLNCRWYLTDGLLKKKKSTFFFNHFVTRSFFYVP